MFAHLRARHCTRALSRSTTRSLATVQSGVPNNQNDNSTPQRTFGSHSVRVDPNHGLFRFFRKKMVDGSAHYETVETPGLTITGSYTHAFQRRSSLSINRQILDSTRATAKKLFGLAHPLVCGSTGTQSTGNAERRGASIGCDESIRVHLATQGFAGEPYGADTSVAGSCCFGASVPQNNGAHKIRS